MANHWIIHANGSKQTDPILRNRLETYRLKNFSKDFRKLMLEKGDGPFERLPVNSLSSATDCRLRRRRPIGSNQRIVVCLLHIIKSPKTCFSISRK